MKKKPLFFIVGPTASGKTAVSIAAAKALSGEIISADSIQIYCGMDIGSAKPDIEERQGIAHHLLDVAQPYERDYSVARYRSDALEAVKKTYENGKTPIVCGGTGLYVNSLIYPLDFPGAPKDEALRTYWNGMEALEPGSAYRQLKRLDPARAAQLHPNDVKRVIRAIEIFTATGRPVQSPGFTARNDECLEYIPVLAGLDMPRALLYERIENRVDEMMKKGLVEEARSILEKYGADVPAMQGLGYKQLAAYFSGGYSFDEAVAAIKIETRHYAKRQLTWFRREERIRWFNVTDYDGTPSLAAAVTEYFKEAING